MIATDILTCDDFTGQLTFDETAETESCGLVDVEDTVGRRLAIGKGGSSAVGGISQSSVKRCVYYYAQTVVEELSVGLYVGRSGTH